jgi:hypothetical protein
MKMLATKPKIQQSTRKLIIYYAKAIGVKKPCSTSNMGPTTAPSANPGTARLCIEPPPPIANHRYAEYDTEARERGS